MSPTFRDMRSQQLRMSFVNRVREIEIFRRLITPASDQPILLISGPGGVGKTSLLLQMARVAQEDEVPIAMADLAAARTPLTVLAEWRAGLSVFSFPRFDSAWKLLYNAAGESSMRLPDERHLSVSSKQTGDYAGLGEGLAQSEYQVTKAFVEDVNVSINGKAPVLMLDSFEMADQHLEKWLIQGLLSWLSARIRMVIAGRSFRGEAWNRLSPLVKEIELGGFDLATAEKYLQMRGVTNPDLAQRLFELTSGSPLALALVASRVESWDQDAAVAPVLLGDAVLETLGRFFEGIPGELRRVVEAAAVLGEFDVDQLSRVCGKDVRDEFERLRQMDFIRVSPAGLRVHEAARNLILQAMETNAPDRLRQLKASARASQMSPREMAIMQALMNSGSATISDLAVQIEVLQGEVGRTIDALVAEALVAQVGLTDDGEPLYSVTESGRLVLKIAGEPS